MHVSHAGICALYEKKLKEINPTLRNISYDIGDLYNFVDGLADLSALVYVSHPSCIYLDVCYHIFYFK